MSEATVIEPNAKKYLSQLAKQGRVEKVTWGWYGVADNYKDFFDFLAKDKHFKVLQKQSAAAFWSGDFIHRDHFTVAVKDRSYGRALQVFSRSRGWNVLAETRDLSRTEYRQIGGLYVEALEETVIDCVKDWAFADAFACLNQNYGTFDWHKISRHYWERIPRSDTRVGQILDYGASILGRETDLEAYSATKTRITDDFIRRQVEEAAERVTELGHTN